MNVELQEIMQFYNNGPTVQTDPLYLNRGNSILELCTKYEIKSVFDSGCKDMIWMRHIDFSQHGIEYIGGDISLPQVDRCREMFPNIKVLHHDCTSDPFPEVDMIISNDVTIHLSNVDKLRFLKNFVSSKVNYLLMSDSGIYDITHAGGNHDVDYKKFPMAHVHWSIDPWNFPEDLESISDYPDTKQLRLLRLWHRDQLTPVVQKIQL